MRSLLSDDQENNETEQQRSIRENIRAGNYNNNQVTEPFNIAEVLAIIKDLKKNKAPGPDGILNEMIQSISDKIAPSLCGLMNTCLAQGIFPQCWKDFKLINLLKDETKDESHPKSYRPICLINALRKIGELLICKRIREWRTLKGICNNQYGFRKGCSTEDAINTVLDFSTQNSSNKYVLGISLDIKGAFDNLWWPALFSRMREMDCSQTLVNLVRDYYNKRRVSLASN